MRLMLVSPRAIKVLSELVKKNDFKRDDLEVVLDKLRISKNAIDITDKNNVPQLTSELKEWVELRLSHDEEGNAILRRL